MQHRQGGWNQPRRPPRMPVPPAPRRDSCALALLGWRSSPVLRGALLRGAVLRAGLPAPGAAARRGLLPGAAGVLGAASVATFSTGARRCDPPRAVPLAAPPAALAGRPRPAVLRGPAAERGPALLPA